MAVILSEAEDRGSFLWISDLRTTAEILRCAQDDTSEFLHTFEAMGRDAALWGDRDRTGVSAPLPGLRRPRVATQSHGQRRGLFTVGPPGVDLRSFRPGIVLECAALQEGPILALCPETNQMIPASNLCCG